MAKVGRKNKYEEFKDGCLLTMTTSWLINNFSTFTKEEKMKVALAICPKGIVQKIEGNINYSAKVIMESVVEANKQANRITAHAQ